MLVERCLRFPPLMQQKPQRIVGRLEYLEPGTTWLLPRQGGLLNEQAANFIHMGGVFYSQPDVQIKVFSRSSRSPLFEKFLAFQRQAKSLEQISQPRVARVLAMERTTSAVVLVEEA